MPTAACPCEWCLVKERGCLGHPSGKTKCEAANSAGVGAPLPMPSHTGVKGVPGGHHQPQGRGGRAWLCLHSGFWGQPLSILSKLGPGPRSAAVANVFPPSPLLLSPRPHARMAFLFVIFHAFFFFLREIAQAADPHGKEPMS